MQRLPSRNRKKHTNRILVPSFTRCSCDDGYLNVVPSEQGEPGIDRPLSETDRFPAIHQTRESRWQTFLLIACARYCQAMITIIEDVPRPIYDAWFAHVQLLSIDGDALLGVPSTYRRRSYWGSSVPLLELSYRMWIGSHVAFTLSRETSPPRWHELKGNLDRTVLRHTVKIIYYIRM